VGPYTARAVAAFAYNADVIFIETNIRTAVMHHFFPRKREVSDKEIEKILEAAFPKGKAREWYSALMDYGAALKKAGVKTNARVKGYAKQAKFDGSFRQARGAVLRALSAGPLPSAKLTMLLGRERESQVKGALASLTKEGLVEIARGKFRLPR
jgi:A/G-specific adenine glycosylase